MKANDPSTLDPTDSVSLFFFFPSFFAKMNFVSGFFLFSSSFSLFLSETVLKYYGGSIVSVPDDNGYRNLFSNAIRLEWM